MFCCSSAAIVAALTIPVSDPTDLVDAKVSLETRPIVFGTLRARCSAARDCRAGALQATAAIGQLSQYDNIY
jgi:hypothetical protein